MVCPADYFKFDQRFTCMIPHTFGLLGDDDQCDVGCGPAFCSDYPDGLVAGTRLIVDEAEIRGRRWARPADTFSRDAYGQIGPLIGFKPKLITARGGRYETAPCFFRTNQQECFDEPVCNCYYDRRDNFSRPGDRTEAQKCDFTARRNCPPGSDPDLQCCCDHTPLGQLYIRKAKGCGVYTGSNWGPTTKYCRAIDYVDSIGFELTPGQLLNTELAQIDGPCTVNMMVGATAHVVGSPCPGSWQQTQLHPPPPGVPQDHEFYNDASNSTLEHFRNLQLQFSGIGIQASNATGADAARIQLANRALALPYFTMRLPTGPGASIRFDNVDNATISDQGNGRIGYWSREWDGPALATSGAISVADFPTVTTLTGRMRTSGCPISGRLAINRVRMRAHVIAISQCNATEATADLERSFLGRQQLLFSIRVFLDVDLVAIANPAIGCVLSRPWSSDLTVSVDNDPHGRSNSRGVNDTIVWQHDGVDVDIPATAHWRGYMGEFALPDPDFSGPRGYRSWWGVRNPNASRNCNPSLRTATCGLLMNLHGQVVRGWPTSLGSNRDDSIYAGRVTIFAPGSARCP